MFRCRYLLLGMVLLHSGVKAADAATPLRINPFVQPQAVVDTGVTTASTAAKSMELRGVMLAGEHSLANIGGKIVGIGEEINGYRLIVVNETNVVLDRDGTRRELGVMTQNGVGNDEQANSSW